MNKKNKMSKPPFFSEWLMKFLFPDKKSYSTIGDLEEVYQSIAEKDGKHRANWWYRKQLISSIKPLIDGKIFFGGAMFKNYLKVTVRNLTKQKSFSFINIFGLALGIATCILILLNVRAEFSYDQYHEHADRIYRIERQYLDANGEVRTSGNTLAPSFTLLLEKDFPEMEHISRIYHASDTRVVRGDKNFIEQRLFFAEHDIFEIFTIPMVNGDPNTALNSPFSIVLSKSTSRKYFGDEDPIGKELEIYDAAYIITGIIEDSPEYSHIHFDFIVSYLSLKGAGGSYNIKEDYFLGSDNFTDNVTYTYARFAKNIDPLVLKDKIPEFLDRNLPPVTLGDGTTSKASKFMSLNFRKVTDIHLRFDGETDIEATSDAVYVNLFTLVALFILIIACVNFVNLSTARAAKRAKEVGLRKVVGAYRHSLIWQFIGESVFYSFVAVIISVLIVYFTIPYFESFIGTKLIFNIFLDPFVLILLFGIFLLTGVLAGLYPAIYLSAFNPASILRGQVTKGTKGALFRKILVVFQFSISVALIMCVIIIYNQMDYMRTADLGFNKENVLMFSADQSIRRQWEDIKNNLLTNPHIISATTSKRAPSGILADAPGFNIEVNSEIVNSPFNMPHNRVGHDFFKTYGMKILAGRDISQEYSTDDSLAYVINESACNRLGWDDPNEAIGVKFKAYGFNEGTIVGVVNDFNYESMRSAIKPVVTYISKGSVNTVAIRISPGDIQSTIEYVQNVLKSYNIESTMEYSFLDERLDALYKNEAKMMELFGYFSFFAIIIACLGLFGLSAFTAEEKTKEIGIRKTLGASILSILLLLTRDYIKWIGFSAAIAWPISYYLMEKWLQNFAYHIDIGWMPFIFSTLFSILIAVLTVSYQVISASITNPIESLKYE